MLTENALKTHTDSHLGHVHLRGFFLLPIGGGQ
jgi:hypothetical protein